ncbi:aminotransferase class IV [uncultured Ruegeria sp.]|uniref:aminotransferase class IV n=1 Tax=uncultured Ruegeria sp. TaxID=259304 RepID=UPI00263022FE|nr:aminotransferase class IV [uncultured Ruegeria sp.]
MEWTSPDLCAEMGIQCNAQDIAAEDLKSADEVFVTSTAGGVMPVSRIDGQSIGSGEVGLLSERMIALYWQFHEDDRYRSVVSYPGST